MDVRMKTLTAKKVTRLMEFVIMEHLGWLVVWGNVFGAIIGTHRAAPHGTLAAHTHTHTHRPSLPVQGTARPAHSTHAHHAHGAKCDLHPIACTLNAGVVLPARGQWVRTAGGCGVLLMNHVCVRACSFCLSWQGCFRRLRASRPSTGTATARWRSTVTLRVRHTRAAWPSGHIHLTWTHTELRESARALKRGGGGR